MSPDKREGHHADKKDPSARTDLIATPVGSNQINLVWQANPLDEDIKYYNIYRRKTDEQEFQLVAKSPTNSYVDRGLKPSNTYYYRVAAVQLGPDPIAGQSSNEVSATTASSPNAPTDLTATPVGSNQINLVWQANPLDEDIKYYNIYRRITAKQEFQLVAKSPINSYADTPLDPSTLYMYQVTAVQASGLEGDRSDEKPATTARLPREVTGLQAVTAGSTQIILEWNANSQEDNVEYYNIYRRKNAKQEFQLVAKSLINSYADTPLDPSTDYFYQVRAVQSSGIEGEP